jgi:hypothetical protein
MVWIGLSILVFSAYFLQLLQAQSQYNRGDLSILDANDFVKNPTIQFYTTFLTIIVILTGIGFLIISVKWWAPLYAIFGIMVGGFIRRITGNPLLGDWSH